MSDDLTARALADALRRIDADASTIADLTAERDKYLSDLGVVLARESRLQEVVSDMQCHCGPYPELDNAWCERCAALADPETEAL